MKKICAIIALLMTMQLWAECRNGKVIDGGSSSPRPYNPETGLKNPDRGW